MDYNDTLEFETFINDIAIAQKKLSLVCFVGAGVSISQGYPNWDRYVKQLINYWTFHLNDLTSLPETRISKVELHDISVLENLVLSDESNKRKVDMVNYIVKKYSGAEDKVNSERIFKEHVLDFEKFLFSEVSPVVVSNEVLDQLVKLRACFITTNYDSQIEKSYQRNFETPVDMIPDIRSISGNIRTETVIHLHGIPEGDSDLFVSSSRSYSSVYYTKNEYGKKIQELFKEKQDSLILFVGCSMEEDEILSLLDLKESNTKFYALMKYATDHFIPKINEKKNSFVKQYYKDQHDVNIMWYGKQFSDLPSFIKKIIDALHEKEAAKTMNPKKIREVLLDE